MVQPNFRAEATSVLLAISESIAQTSDLSSRLREWGYSVDHQPDYDLLVAHILRTEPSIVLLDLGHDHSRMSLLKELTRRFKGIPFIVMSSNATVEGATYATRVGAFDVFEIPPDLKRLRKTIDDLRDRRRPTDTSTRLDLARGVGPHRMLGRSQAMLDVLSLVNDVAESDATVLILGESGTGKELLARAIHACSQRKQQPFVPVNVAALPATISESILFGHEKGAFTGADTATKGWCETANGGTLMLDEIGEMDILLQTKLLRFLQDGSFLRVGSSKPQHSDVRVIAATNRNPEELIVENRMREDLYYRLNVFPIHMPPLRERREDIPLLANSFLEVAVEVHRRHVAGFTDEAMRCLMDYSWPGNVRQLENLVTRMLLLAREPYIGIENMPREIMATYRHDVAHNIEADSLSQMERVEKQAIVDALKSTNYNAVAAARLLGVGQATIYRKIKRFNIDISRSRSFAARSPKTQTLAKDAIAF